MSTTVNVLGQVCLQPGGTVAGDETLSPLKSGGGRLHRTKTDGGGMEWGQAVVRRGFFVQIPSEGQEPVLLFGFADNRSWELIWGLQTYGPFEVPFDKFF